MLVALWLTGCGAPDGDWPEPSPALWEVTAPSGEKGWLFGTIHALPDGIDWRSAAIEGALADSDVLVVEIAELGSTSGAALLSDMAETPGQPPLLSRVEPSERAAVEAMLVAADMDESDFSRTETWGAALVLNAATRPADAANGVDRALIADAERVWGLEAFACLLYTSPSPRD